MNKNISYAVFHRKTGEKIQGRLTESNAIILATSLTVSNGVEPYYVRREKTAEGKVRYLEKVTYDDKVKAVEVIDRFISDLPSLSVVNGVHEELLLNSRTVTM